MLALISVNDSLALIEASLLVIGCGLGLNTGPVNAVAVANVPAARSGTASGLVNTARMVGATLGVAILGAVFAMFSDGIGDRGHIVAGLAPAYICGGAGEMIGAWVAFMFIRHDSLRQRIPDHVGHALRPLPHLRSGEPDVATARGAAHGS